jgi:hypothetical protein
VFWNIWYPFLCSKFSRNTRQVSAMYHKEKNNNLYTW